MAVTQPARRSVKGKQSWPRSGAPLTDRLKRRLSLHTQSTRTCAFHECTGLQSLWFRKHLFSFIDGATTVFESSVRNASRDRNRGIQGSQRIPPSGRDYAQGYSLGGHG